MSAAPGRPQASSHRSAQHEGIPVSLSPRPRGCFVTGTDTEVGKTRISAALLHWCARQGWRSAGFKPVAAGTELVDGVRVNDDVRTLRLASSLALTDAEVEDDSTLNGKRPAQTPKIAASATLAWRPQPGWSRPQRQRGRAGRR